MKKLIISIFALLLTTQAQAEQIPDGCYVAFNDPDFCYIAPSGFYEWTRFADDETTKFKYGRAVGSIIIEGKTSDAGLASCNASYNILLADRNSIAAQIGSCNANYNSLLADRNSIATQQSTCIADFNSLVSRFNVNVGDFNSQLKLVKKLRKACGTKCKKIK